MNLMTNAGESLKDSEIMKNNEIILNTFIWFDCWVLFGMQVMVQQVDYHLLFS